MARYANIDSVTFGATPLPLPLSVRLSRCAEPLAAGCDKDVYATSIEIGRPVVSVEVCVRGTATAECLSVGQQDDLVVVITPAEDTSPARELTISGAVLVGIETSYQQAAAASATLRFVAEAAGSTEEPFAAEDAA